MKTQYYTAASLDGFIATEEDSLDWLFPLGDVNETSYPAFIAEVGALAMGSATYEWMLRHAQTVTAETGSAWPYTQPTWVFSSRALPAIPGANPCFVRGDVRPVHSAMRAVVGDRNIWIVGGGDLAGQFYDARAPGRGHRAGGFRHSRQGEAAVPPSAHQPAAGAGFGQASGHWLCGAVLSSPREPSYRYRRIWRSSAEPVAGADRGSMTALRVS